MRRKTAQFAAGAIALGTLVAGCGGGDAADNKSMPGMSQEAAATAEQGGVNNADIAFAQQMIPHHEEAIEMAKLALSRASDEKVVELAKQIQQAQDPEIQKLTGWLRQWGAPTPDDGMDHGRMRDGDMPGMTSDTDMMNLEKAEGTEFDRMWMQMMIKHHEGAIEMAKAELEDGSHEGAKRMAREIIDGQQAEVDTMKDLLRKS